MSRACIGSDERTDGTMAVGAGAEKKGTDKLRMVAGPDGQLLEDELGVTESGRKRNWVEGQNGKVDLVAFLRSAPHINARQHCDKHAVNNSPLAAATAIRPSPGCLSESHRPPRDRSLHLRP